MRSVQCQMSSARIPVHGDLAGFDFVTTVLDKKLFQQLATAEFTATALNALLVGGADFLGITGHGNQAWFYSTVDLVNALEQDAVHTDARNDL